MKNGLIEFNMGIIWPLYPSLWSHFRLVCLDVSSQLHSHFSTSECARETTRRGDPCKHTTCSYFCSSCAAGPFNRGRLPLHLGAIASDLLRHLLEGGVTRLMPNYSQHEPDAGAASAPQPFPGRLATWLLGPLSSLMFGSQFFSGGLAMTVMSFILKLLRYRFRSFVKNACFVVVTVAEKEDCFEMLREWLYARLTESGNDRKVRRPMALSLE